jgi:hypothetical protein
MTALLGSPNVPAALADLGMCTSAGAALRSYGGQSLEGAFDNTPANAGCGRQRLETIAGVGCPQLRAPAAKAGTPA